MSLYDTLGVARDADAEQIKHAYRRKAMEHHPDRGGDKEEFQRVQEAYDVLSDPERRARYDQTGATTNQPTLREMAVSALHQTLNEVLDQIDPDAIDPLALCRRHIHEALETNQRTIANERKRIDKRRRAVARVKRKEGVGANVLQGSLAQAIEALEGAIAQIEQKSALCREVLDVLAEYGYEVDEAPQTQAQARQYASIEEMFRDAVRRSGF